MKKPKKKKGKCSKIKDDGTYCKAYASGAMGLCVFHERQYRAEQRKGNQVRAIKEGRIPEKIIPSFKPKPIKKAPVVPKKKEVPTITKKALSIQDLMDTVAQTIQDVQSGKASEKYANSITKLAKIQADLLIKLPPKEEDDQELAAQIKEQIAELSGKKINDSSGGG